MDAQTVGLLVGGLLGLILGAEALVRGAAALAAMARISPLVVGLTVVAFGTSTPELAVSLGAGMTGQAGLALGNVIGSNLFNTLMIVGVAALLSPLATERHLVRVDVPIMIVVTGGVWAMAANGSVSRWEGLLLVLLLLAYGGLLVAAARRVRSDACTPRLAPATAQAQTTHRTVLLAVMGVCGGLAVLSVGARWFVDAAVAMARALGVGEMTIGLTIVAAGTSLPELATTVIAGLRGHAGLAVGNVVGSNVFNLLAVLGGTALAAGRVPVPERALRVDLPVLLGIAIVCLPLFLTGRRVGRLEGTALLLGYGLYIGFLIAGR